MAASATIACGFSGRPMFIHSLAVQFIRHSLSTTSGAVAAIFVGVLIQEDVATVAVGMMAADHLVNIPLAMISLGAATIVNNIAMYGVGWLALTFPSLRRWVRDRPSLRALLNDRLISTVMTTQFLPAARLPIYAGCGFFALPFPRFAAVASIAAILWSPTVFTCAYFYGMYALTWFGLLRWPIALAFLIAWTFVARTYWRNLASEAQDPREPGSI